MKKIFKFIILPIIVLLMIYSVLYFYLGGINYKETINTKYYFKDNNHIIETSHFKIQTPKNWIHVFIGYGYEADAEGVFITKNGIIRYEYGYLSNTFRVDSVFVFYGDSLTANKYQIYFGFNENKSEMGIHIPCQNNMEWPFSFYMSEACLKNKEDIIKGIKTMEFKKFYNITDFENIE